MMHNVRVGLRSLPALYVNSRALARYVVPQEYGIEDDEKVRIGVQIGAAMVDKLRRDLLAGMQSSSHEQDRLYQLDHQAATDVRTAKRHVRTRLYFTSESHMFCLFNVLRHGGDVISDQDQHGGKGDGSNEGAGSGSGGGGNEGGPSPFPSIFSEAAQARFAEMEICYLAHIVFRVFLRPPEQLNDPLSPNRYCVQVLVSTGVDHHGHICDAYRADRKSAGDATATDGNLSTLMVADVAGLELSPDATPRLAEEVFVASAEDLSVEAVDRFITEVLKYANSTQSTSPPSVSDDCSRPPTPSSSRRGTMAASL